MENIGFMNGSNPEFVTDTLVEGVNTTTVGNLVLDNTDWFHIYDKGDMMFDIALQSFPAELQGQIDTIVRLD